MDFPPLCSIPPTGWRRAYRIERLASKNYKYMAKIVGYIKMLFTEDKLKHIVVSAIIMVALSLVLPKWAAAIITLAIGVAKEAYDKLSKKGYAEWEDLVADAVGIVIGLL
jgi:hypothetical protein